MTRAGGGPVAIGISVGLLVACTPVVMPVGPREDGGPPDFGPTLVVDVVNASEAEVPVSYELDSDNAGGGGEGSVPRCERFRMELGDVAGRYELSVGGTAVIDADIPAPMPARGYLLAKVRVDADGDVTLEAPPQWVASAPGFRTARVQGCG